MQRTIIKEYRFTPLCIEQETLSDSSVAYNVLLGYRPHTQRIATKSQKDAEKLAETIDRLSLSVESI